MDTPPPDRSLTGITISGPTQVDENSEAQYVCEAQYSDGTRENVIAMAAWAVDSGGYATIAGGTLTALEVSGEQPVTISAGFEHNNIAANSSLAIAILDSAPGPLALEESHAEYITTYDGTVTCLACHTEQAQEVHASVHYQWKGDAYETTAWSPQQPVNWAASMIFAYTRISTGSASLPTAQVTCTNCHAPEHDEDIQKHTARVNCTVCHIPTFAKVAGTDMNRDWSHEGVLVEEKGVYEPYHVKKTNVVPEYKFFNGLSYFYQFGDAVVTEENGRVVMSAPEGNINDPAAKIYAFKRHQAKQPVEPNNGRLLPLKIGIFFQTGDLEEAVAQGAERVNWPYNGHEFADTERYMGLFHEVAPKEQALSCNDCHNGGNRLDFAALGYTPKATNNGKSLCASCHEDESTEWPEDYFKKVHAKYVTDKKLDCSKCHDFSLAN